MPELAIIFVVALVVLGPKKLPPLVQQVGRWVGRARHMARQFREQLEQEVNSINEVKPVPMPAPPDVGPTQPDVTAANDSGHADIGSAATAAPAPVEPAGSDIHPEGQIYFALNGTEPAVVGQDPYAPQLPADELQAVAEAPAAIATDEHAPAVPLAPVPTPEPAVKAADPGQPASVEVIFPHDHV